MRHLLLSLLPIAGCALASAAPSTFKGDVEFLRKHTKVIVLRNGRSRAAVAPAWQGRVMTSALAPDDPGFGWINYNFIATGKLVPHMNVFGGEDRLWLGPEGGQFALFFKKGDKFDVAHWQTPPFMDTKPFAVVKSTPSSATFERTDTLANYSGTKFHVRVTRKVTLLGAGQALKDLGCGPLPGVSVVAFETKNRLTNLGKTAWTEKSGMPSIWLLGQFNQSPTTTVVAPFHPGPEDKMGKIVNSAYFGPVPDSRLKVGEHDVFFKADGQYRSKIGLNPHRATGVIGSYDPAKGLLTVLLFTHPAHNDKYVNSMWEIQKKPFGGDETNSYNDGPLGGGQKQLGPFYEIESSSPAAHLAAGATIQHTQVTFHLQGPKDELEKVSKKVFGVGLDEVASAFSS